MSEQNLEQLAQEFKKQVDEVKSIAEDFKGKREHGDKIAEGLPRQRVRARRARNAGGRAASLIAADAAAVQTPREP